MKKWIFASLVIGLLFSLPGTLSGSYWKFPPLPPPHEYGNILVNRTSEANQVKPVFFSHWSHRLKYSCRVCHLELDFEFLKNSTEITEQDNLQGRYCGACHDGKEVFGHTKKEDCEKCHSGSKSEGQERFEALTGGFPRTFYGNRIDWVAAEAEGRMKPKYSLRGDTPPTETDFKRRLELKAEWSFIPPAYFPHEPHTAILDCANCHPAIFNIEKNTTPDFRMDFILQRRFCGVCHLDVAFPLDDCNRCHPGISKQ